MLRANINGWMLFTRRVFADDDDDDDDERFCFFVSGAGIPQTRSSSSLID